MKSSILNSRLTLFAVLLGALLSGCEEKPVVSSLRWSPDGKSIAYVFKKVLFVRPVTEEGLTLDASDLALAEDHFAWTADSKGIIYTSAKEGSWDLWRLDVRTGQSVRLTDDLDKEHLPLCAARSDQVIYLSWKTLQPNWWLLDLRSGEVKQVTRHELEPSKASLSRTGERLAYLVSTEDGSQEIRLLQVWLRATTVLAQGLHGVFQVALSPDGQRIAWAASDSSRGSGIWTASIPKNLKKVKPQLCVRLAKPGPPTVPVFDWTADSERIVYADKSRVWIKPAAKGDKLRSLIPQRWIGPWLAYLDFESPPITDEGWAASLATVSSESGLIACVLAEQGEFAGVFVMDVTGKGRRWLAKSPDELRRAARLEAKAGNAEAAESLLMRALELAPNPQSEAEVARDLSALFLKSAEVEKGVGLLEEVVRDHLALGRAYLLYARDIDKAKAELEQVSDEKQKPEAASLLKAISDLDEQALDHFCQAEVAKEKGQSVAALRHMSRVVDLAPSSQVAKGLAAEVAREASGRTEPKRAVDALDRIIAAYPDSPEALDAALAKARILRVMKGKPKRGWRLFFWRPQFDAEVAAKHFAEIRPLYDQLEYARSRSPKVADVLNDAAEFYAEDLLDYPGAADKLEKLITFKSGSREAAKEVSEEKVKEFSAQLLQYELKAIDLYLNKLNDVPRAMAVARRSPGFELKGDRVDVQALFEILKRFDEARRHKEANTLLAEAMKAAVPDDWFTLKLEDLAYMAKFVKKDVLVRCRLGHLPNWLDERIQIALTSLTQQTQDAEVARFAMQALGAWTGRQVEKLLANLSEEPLGASERANDLKSLAYYVLGNYFQTKRDAKQALFYYHKLFELQGSTDDLAVIEECQSLVPRYSYVALRWLDAERAGGGPLWKGIIPIITEITEPGKTAEKDFEREAAKAYEEFIHRYSRWALLDDAYWRLSSLTDARTKAKYLLRLVEECPSSRYVPSALKQLVDAYESTGNLWLGVQVLETLRQLDNQQGNVPDVTAAIGQMRERLKLTDLMAQNARQADELLNKNDFANAAPLLELLLSAAPRYPWLRSENTRLALARCYESLELWEEAELAYFKLFTQHRDVYPSPDRGLLPGLLPRFSDQRVLDLCRAQPQDVLNALPKLDAAQKERVQKLLTQSKKRL